ncbi:hypothetical protein V2J09_001918 [Rumex salicifolius]
MIPLQRQSSLWQSKERLLSRKEYSELGLSGSNGVEDGSSKPNLFSTACDKIHNLWLQTRETSIKAYEMGRSDPRKVVFAAKMGLALALISLLVFFKEPESISSYSVWAVMTVVVVFEFSIGATFNKGFNRALGTVSAGTLSVGLGELSKLTGVLEEPIIIFSIFIAGSSATYVKQHPTLKEYEYGFRVFLLTYCIVLVSDSSDFIDTALTRLVLIAIGAAVCLVVNTFIYPIWAGEDLHKLVVKNFKGVATSLEGCINSYLQCVEYERVPSKILVYQASDDPVYSGYRSAVQSASQEESLMTFATWEPPHGRYRTCKYPWNLYLKVSGALRHCAFMVMAMHGCMLSEIQAPADLRKMFSKEIKTVSIEGAKVLREVGEKVEKMEKLNNPEILIKVHKAAEDLQMLIDQKSYLFINSKSWQTKANPKVFSHSQSFAEPKDSKYNNSPVMETVADFAQPRRSVPNLPRPNQMTPQTSVSRSFTKRDSSGDVFRRLTSWPSRLSADGERVMNEREAMVFESASALSFATFTTMLVEFVARLQNLVDSFKELEVQAKFKNPHKEVRPKPMGRRVFDGQAKVVGKKGIM